MVFLRTISEYRTYDLENGLEIYPDGMVFTKQEIRQHYKWEICACLTCLVVQNILHWQLKIVLLYIAVFKDQTRYSKMKTTCKIIVTL